MLAFIQGECAVLTCARGGDVILSAIMELDCTQAAFDAARAVTESPVPLQALEWQCALQGQYNPMGGLVIVAALLACIFLLRKKSRET